MNNTDCIGGRDPRTSYNIIHYLVVIYVVPKYNYLSYKSNNLIEFKRFSCIASVPWLDRYENKSRPSYGFFYFVNFCDE